MWEKERASTPTQTFPAPSVCMGKNLSFTNQEFLFQASIQKQSRLYLDFGNNPPELAWRSQEPEGAWFQFAFMPTGSILFERNFLNSKPSLKKKKKRKRTFKFKIIIYTLTSMCPITSFSTNNRIGFMEHLLCAEQFASNIHWTKHVSWVCREAEG